MAGERNAWAPFGGDRAGTPAPILLRAVLALAIVAACGIVVIELARIGPFAPAKTGFLATPITTPVAPPAAPRTAADAVRLPRGNWRWQFHATGTPAGDTTGPVLVRAWQLTSRCRPGAACRVQFARQLVVPSAPGEVSDRAVLRPESGGAPASTYRARFAPVVTRCTYPAATQRSTPTTIDDDFVLRWSGRPGALAAAETSRYVCGGHVYVSTYAWTAVRVTAPAARAPAGAARARRRRASG